MSDLKLLMELIEGLRSENAEMQDILDRSVSVAFHDAMTVKLRQRIAELEQAAREVLSAMEAEERWPRIQVQMIAALRGEGDV